MRWPRTLSLYATREIVQYTLLGLAAIAIVMLTRSLVRVLDELVAAGFRLQDLLTVAGLLATMLTIYALPVSFLFGVLLAMGRMAADLEITAMRACGIGTRGLLLPVVVLGLLLSLLSLELTLHAEPAARREMAAAVRRMLVRGASVAAGGFSTVGDRTLYVDAREGDDGLRGIAISDSSDPERPFMVFAESGRMSLDEERAELSLTLERGDVHIEPREGDDRYQRLGFERFEYKIDVGALMEGHGLRPREMTLDELRQVTRRIAAGEDPGHLREEPASYASHLQQRYALPAAPLLFALVGVPLGMRRQRGARSYGVILCAVLAFSYYALHSFAELLVVERGFPPLATLWLPNAVFAAVGALLIFRLRRSG